VPERSLQPEVQIVSEPVSNSWQPLTGRRGEIEVPQSRTPYDLPVTQPTAPKHSDMYTVSHKSCASFISTTTFANIDQF